MKRTRRAVAATVPLALALSLAACSSDDDSSSAAAGEVRKRIHRSAASRSRELEETTASNVV